MTIAPTERATEPNRAVGPSRASTADRVECAACEPSASWAVGQVCEECGGRSEWHRGAACPRCLGPLVVDYRRPDGPEAPLPSTWAGRPATLFRFAELLPPLPRPYRDRLEFPFSPLRRALRLGEQLGLDELWIKDDTVLASGSFKDRPAAVAVAWAAAHGRPWVGCASTGNLAAATARAAARLGLPCIVVVPSGLPRPKLRIVRHLGACILEVNGSYDDANRIAQLTEETRGGGFVNIGLRPIYAEGSKTLLFETWADLSGRLPDAVIVPLGSGALLSATQRAQEQLRSWAGAPDPPARLIGTQPEGCSPIVDAFERGDEEIRPVERSTSIAESLAIGHPASGRSALRAIRTTGGLADRPRRAEVVRGVRELARWEGVYSEPAGGSVVATLRRLREQGALRRSDRVVLYLTGAGWKTPTAVRPLGTESRPVRVDLRRPELDSWPLPADDSPMGGSAW